MLINWHTKHLNENKAAAAEYARSQVYIVPINNKITVKRQKPFVNTKPDGSAWYVIVANICIILSPHKSLKPTEFSIGKSTANLYIRLDIQSLALSLSLALYFLALFLALSVPSTRISSKLLRLKSVTFLLLIGFGISYLHNNNTPN